MLCCSLYFVFDTINFYNLFAKNSASAEAMTLSTGQMTPFNSGLNYSQYKMEVAGNGVAEEGHLRHADVTD